MAEKKAASVQLQRVPRDLYKAHQAIAVTPSPGSKITLLDRRFFNALLEEAQKQGNKDVYRTPLASVLSGANFTSTNYEVAKAVLRSLAKTTVEWSIVETDSPDGATKGQKIWGITSLVAHASLISEGKGSRVMFEWSYSPVIRSGLLSPERYVGLPMDVFVTLSTNAAAALYEICMRYLSNRNGLTSKDTWESWRPRLTGVSNESAGETQYKFFKRDTLVPAIKEINAVTNIEVELREFKTGRKITHIQFSSSIKTQKSLNVSESVLPHEEIIQRLSALGFDDAATAKFYTSYDAEILLDTLAFVEERIKKGDIASPAALFRDALKKGYGAREGKKLARPKAPEEATVKGDTKPLPLQGATQVKDEPSKLAAIEEYIKNLSAKELKPLLTRFEAQATGLVKEQFVKSGMKAKIVRVAFAQFVADSGKVQAM